MGKIKWLGLFLKTTLIINLLFFVFGFVMLFIISDTYGIYASGICSASALFNCIGLVLLIRHHHVGAIVVAVASFVASFGLSITCAGWLSFSFGLFGIYLPYIICILYLGILSMLLIHKRGGISEWSQMDSSFDYAHFRHIYQLSTCLLFSILCITFFFIPDNPESGSDNVDDIKVYISNVSEKRLNSPDITIEEVVSFENSYNINHSVNDREPHIVNRIFALKHLLLVGLMPKIHSKSQFVTICLQHKGSFSHQQQSIIDWFLSLDEEDQLEWNVCDNVNTLSDFRFVIEKKICN